MGGLTSTWDLPVSKSPALELQTYATQQAFTRVGASPLGYSWPGSRVLVPGPSPSFVWLIPFCFSSRHTWILSFPRIQRLCKSWLWRELRTMVAPLSRIYTCIAPLEASSGCFEHKEINWLRCKLENKTEALNEGKGGWFGSETGPLCSQERVNSFFFFFLEF